MLDTGKATLTSEPLVVSDRLQVVNYLATDIGYILLLK